MFRKKNSTQEDGSFKLDQKNVKTRLNENLAHTVKALQKECRLSSSPVHSESTASQHICSVLEAAFIHGLKVSYYEKEQSRSTSRTNFPNPQFWNLINKVSHAETINRVQALTYITSRIGKCRAWLRLTLNDGAVTSYLATILSKDHRSTLMHYYDQHALFLDQEHAEIFLRYLQGVESVIFELSYNSSMLNQWTKTPLELAGLIPLSSTAPLYAAIQSSIDNNNSGKTTENGSASRRASAPASSSHQQFSRSLPSSSNLLSPRARMNKENITINEEEVSNSSSIESKTETSTDQPGDEDTVLHRRHLLKKKKRRKFGMGSRNFESLSSLSSDSGTSGSNSSLRKNTPRSNSFCEVPSVATLMKNSHHMTERKSSTRGSNTSTPTSPDIDMDPVENFRQFKNSNTELSSAGGRKNPNLKLSKNKLQRDDVLPPPPNADSVRTSFPPDVAGESHVREKLSSLEDSVSSQSSGKIEKKLNSQIPFSDAYNLSFVSPLETSVSSEGSPGEFPHGESPQSEGTVPDTMQRSTDAIDIYSNSQEEGKSLNDGTEDDPKDMSTPSRLGNSLSFGGGWSSDQSTSNTPLSTVEVDGKVPVSNQFFPKTPVSPDDEKFEDKFTTNNFIVNDSRQYSDSNENSELFIRREGYLKKLGEKLKLWKKRWFVLRGSMIYYYKDEHSKDYLGKIDLTDVLMISEETQKQGADVEITMNDGTQHHLAAEDRQLTLDWASDFRKIIGPGSPKSTKESKSHSYLEEYEVISVRNHLLENHNTSWHASMISHLSRIANEKGLDSQNYQCADCASPIGIIYGQPRLCGFTGQYYCHQCHSNEEAQIPARMIHNWDFRKHKVAKRSKSFLEQVSTDPLINLKESNAGIYRYIDEMRRILELREQLRHLKPYLQTCRQFNLDEITTRLGPKLYFFDDSHLYSVSDLCSTQDKSLTVLLNKLVNSGTKHVYGCTLCKAKGFLCEICHSDKVIFPFETRDTTQCPECKSVFHQTCKTETQNCPRCERRQRRFLINIQEQNADVSNSASDQEN